MASFQSLCEAIGRDFWDNRKKDNGELDDKSMSIILRGLEVRPDRTDGNTFWDDFISVIANNSENASRLLGVSGDTISRWAGRIREGIKKAREENAPDERADMVSTGP